MIIKTLKGIIVKGCGNARKNFRLAKPFLVKRGINIDDMYPGTINVLLEEEFKCDDYCALTIYSHELNKIPKIEKQNDPSEIWRFIPILEINRIKIKGYVYRTTHGWKENPEIKYGYHGPKTIEIFLQEKIPVKIGDEISVTLFKSPFDE